MTLADRLTALQPQALAVLRMVTALLLMQHGTQILFNFPDSTKPVEGFLPTLHSFGGMLQFFVGGMVVLGLFTRPAAFLLCGMMAHIYWFYGEIPKAAKSIWPVMNGGETSILWCFVFMYLVFAGPGAWSLDGCMTRKGATLRVPPD